MCGFSPTIVRKAARGVVVGRAGVFSSKYRVSFPSGHVNVPVRDLRPRFIASGSDLAAGYRLGIAIFIFGLPALAMIRYLLAGGSVSAMCAALPGQVLEMAFGLIHFGVAI